MYAIRSYYVHGEAVAIGMVVAATMAEIADRGIVMTGSLNMANLLNILPGLRITSYNVCYTKLLRAWRRNLI